MTDPTTKEADERADEAELYQGAERDEVRCALALFRSLGKDFNQYRAVKVDGPLNWTITKPRTPEALLAALATEEPLSPLEAARPIIERLNSWERFQTNRYGWTPPDGKRIEVRAGDLRKLRASSTDTEDGAVERLEDLLDTERYKVAIGVQAIARAVQGRQWLSQPGRGSYVYDDERYQQEFGAALDEIMTALKPLQAIAQDWSDCPRDPLRVAANRAAALKPGDA
jgi:hypothetical protein